MSSKKALGAQRRQNENKREMNQNKATRICDQPAIGEKGEESKRSSKLRSRGQKEQKTQGTRVQELSPKMAQHELRAFVLRAHSGHMKGDIPVGTSRSCQHTIIRV